MNDQVAQRSVLITGGTGSVGRALIQVFAEAGMSVTFQYDRNQQTAESLSHKFGAKAVQADFTRDHGIPDAVFDFDVLVNNAGINISKVPASEVTDEEWDTTLSVNLSTPFRLIRSCLPRMAERHWGRIINISSIYGFRVTERNLSYNVSKFGLSGLTKSVAKEFAPVGITCNEICPGPIDSELMDRIANQKRATSGIDPAEFLRSVAASIPAQRLARPAEVASLALFLASDAAAYINGVSIPVDGAITT